MGSSPTLTNQRFDDWLKEWLQKADYGDLPSFAAALESHLNATCKGKPLSLPVGIHVAGIHPWAEGPIPMFFHVHNGHSHIQMVARHEISDLILPEETGDIPFLKSISNGTSVYTFPTGVPEPPKIVDFLRATQFAGTRTVFESVDDARSLFRAIRDFPVDRFSPDQNLQILKNGFLTRNGDYAPFTIISGALDMARISLNSIEGVSFPKHPGDLDAHINYLRFLMETVIKVYSNSSMERRIGGTIRCLGIRNSGTYFEKTGWAPRK